MKDSIVDNYERNLRRININLSKIGSFEKMRTLR